MSHDPQERRALRFWINAALEANRRDHTPAIVPDPGDNRGPFRSARALTMTLMAMHDAFEAGQAHPAPFRPEMAPPGPVPDPVGAACSAAWHLLMALYPRQGNFLQAQLAMWKMSHAVDARSEAAGHAVAAACRAWRSKDEPYMAKAPYAPHAEFDHVEDPEDCGQGYAGVRWGDAAPFLMPADAAWLVPPPGAMAMDGLVENVPFKPGPYYMQELAEVRDFGALHSHVRSQHQLETGIFWGYDGADGIGTPPRLYMQVALAVLDQRPRSYSPREWLHALAAVAVAMGDAGIQAWRFKYSPLHMLWRPVVGVRHAQPQGEARWKPYGKPATNGMPADVGKTPDFPAYPSGHATFGAAAMEVLRNFIRDREALAFTDAEEDTIAFRFTSDELDGTHDDPVTGGKRPLRERLHASLWEAIVDNSLSRVFLGVHWRLDGISRLDADGASVSGTPGRPGELGEYGGTALGMQIGRWLARERGFAPAPAHAPAQPVPVR